MTVYAVATFQPLIESTFRVTRVWDPTASDPAAADQSPDRTTDDSTTQTDELDIALRLKHVHDLAIPGPYEQFRLTFEGPRNQSLEQGTYVLDHEEAPLDGVLLVPSSERDDLRIYEASFSVTRPAAESIEP